ncbi:MAG: 2-hydroxyacid dehydrogenase [Candidatus Puniceispirillales bacterium]
MSDQTDIPVIYHSSDAPMSKWQEWLHRLDSRIRLIPLDDKDAKRADVMITWSPPYGAIAKLENLKGVISLAQGVDHLLDDPSLPRDIIVGRLIDPFMSQSMAEWVMLAILKQHRDEAAYSAAAIRKDWLCLEPRIPADYTVSVMGIGAIGGHVAEKIASFGFNVLGWSRTEKSLAGVTSLTGTDGFDHCLKQADYVVSVLPLTDSTRDIYDANAFQVMKTGAYFINCGRGLQVVEDDLISAIDQGQLSGACLDVFRQEPLPADHPLWVHDKVTVWPHVSAQTSPITAAKQVLASIMAIREGKPPVNPVDISRGY